jgi:hypothetical protein
VRRDQQPFASQQVAAAVGQIVQAHAATFP